MMFGGFEIVGETEKAYKLEVECVRLNGDEVTKTMWCPKSCMLTDEEEQAIAEEKKARFENGCKRYEALVNFAKENGLAVRVKMRAETILAKIAEAGLVYNY